MRGEAVELLIAGISHRTRSSLTNDCSATRSVAMRSLFTRDECGGAGWAVVDPALRDAEPVTSMQPAVGALRRP